MKTFLLTLLSMLVITSQAFATNYYQNWCGGSSKALTPGNRGVIIPVASGDDLAQVPGATQMALESANAKAINYRWSIGEGVDGSMTPEQISTKLSGKADFFVVMKAKNDPSIDEYFPDQDLPYEAGEEWEYIKKKYDSKGNITTNEHYTVPIKKRTEYVHVEGDDYHFNPTWLEILVYDSTGRQILTDYSITNLKSLEDGTKNNMDAIMSYIKDYSTVSPASKYNNPPKMKTSTYWKDPNFKFDKKALFNVAPTTSSVAYFKNSIAASNSVDCNLIFQGKVAGMNVSRYGNGVYRMEADIVAYEKNIKRTEPYVEIISKSDTIHDHGRKHDNFYTDTDKIISHTKTGRGHSGSLEVSYDNFGLIIRVFNTATNKLVFSYSGSAASGLSGSVVLIDDFYKKLQK